ncbi:hypothetical protein ACIBL3_03095 [Kribbella sp. NPDC050124]|uniref:hypothetical protein n=1 Tax=Kribbella sp. NPDC050124 TaxID=3364114 RepID=UPI0037BD335C
MLETYRGIPHLLDTWLVLTGMALPIALSSLRRPGDVVPQLGRSCQLHDLVANTLGAFAGVGLAAGLQTLIRDRRLVAVPYVVEHSAMLVVRGRPPARHRRELVPRAVPVTKPANGLRQIARAR